jgi:serine/threonine protein kinase
MLFEKHKSLKRSYFLQAKIMLKFNHPNIVKFFSIFDGRMRKLVLSKLHTSVSNLVSAEQSLYIQMEYCDGGDMKLKIETAKNKKEHFTEDQVPEN